MEVFLVSVKQISSNEKLRTLFLKEEYDEELGSLEFTEDRNEAYQYASVRGAELAINFMKESMDLLETLTVAGCGKEWEIVCSRLVISE